MPLGRAGVGHRLDDVVLGLQRGAEGLGGAPDLAVAGPHRVSIEAQVGDGGPGIAQLGGPGPAVRVDMEAAPAGGLVARDDRPMHDGPDVSSC